MASKVSRAGNCCNLLSLKSSRRRREHGRETEAELQPGCLPKGAVCFTMAHSVEYLPSMSKALGSIPRHV